MGKPSYKDHLLRGVEVLASRCNGPFTMSEIKAEIPEEALGDRAEPCLRNTAQVLVDAGILQRAGTADTFFCVFPAAAKRGPSEDASMAETPAKRRKSAGPARPPTPAKNRGSLRSAPAAARKTRQSITSPPAPARKPRRRQIAPATTVAIAPPAAAGHDRTASDGDDDENMGDAGTTSDEGKNLERQVDRLTDELEKAKKEIAELRAGKENAVTGRYSPNSRGNKGDNDMHQANFDTVDQQEFEPLVAGPSRVADAAQSPSSSILRPQGSNAAKLYPTPDPTDLVSPTSNHAGLQSVELEDALEDVRIADAEIARLREKEGENSALIRSLRAELEGAQARHARELAACQDEVSSLQNQLADINAISRRQQADLDFFDQLRPDQQAKNELVHLEFARIQSADAASPSDHDHVGHLQLEINDLRSKYSQVQLDLEAEKVKCHTAEAECRNTTVLLDNSKSKSSLLDMRREQLLEEAEELRKEITDLHEEIADITKDRDQLLDENTILRQQQRQAVEDSAAN